MLRTQKPLHARPRQDRAQELRGDFPFKQPVAILGKHRVIPHRIVDTEADKPAEQQIPVAPSTAAPSESNRTLAAASSVIVSPVTQMHQVLLILMRQRLEVLLQMCQDKSS